MGLVLVVIQVLLPPCRAHGAAFGAEDDQFALAENPHRGNATWQAAAHRPPAGAQAAQAVLPLWGGATPGGYFARRGPFGDAAETGGLPSATCLSCHDGVMSLDRTDQGLTTVPRVVGGRLSANHPVEVEYAPFRTKFLHLPSRVIPGSAARVADLLVDGKVECTSCHATREDQAIPQTALLRREYAGLRLDMCTACHDM